jgi:lactate dehydrogenase-like 2-hydroxyacid dehydrogenase
VREDFIGSSEDKRVKDFFAVKIIYESKKQEEREKESKLSRLHTVNLK